MSWKDLFKPRQDKFLRLLIEQAAKTLEGMEALEEYMKDDNEETAMRVTKIEKEADEVRRILIDELLHTFITPIDREDIFALSRAIDDIIDYGYTTVDEMEILDVDPNPHLQHMVSKLRKAAEEIHLGVLRLKDHPNVANDHAVRAKALENQVEQIYREAIADLFKGAPKNLKQVVKMLKLREIYRHLSNCADRGDEAANIIGDIVVKRT
jgi:predicted phosphate transport protein (TIGR00153 family)